jgi:hypothetical protein
MIARDRVLGIAFLGFTLVPFALVAVVLIWADPAVQKNLVALLLFFGCGLAAGLGWVVRILLDRRDRPGLLFTPIRGGKDALVEIRAKSGVGQPLLLPMRATAAQPRIYKVGMKRMVVTELNVPTSIGEVLMVRGGTSLDRDTMRWVNAVFASDGSEVVRPSAAAVHVDTIAAAAQRAPLDPPGGIEAFVRRGWPVWRYPTAIGPEAGMLWPWMLMLALLFVFLPMLQEVSRWTMAAWMLPIELVLLYGCILAGPAMAEFEVRTSMVIRRRKRFGLTLWIGVSDARAAGVDAVSLPKCGVRFAPKTCAVTSPLVGGPDVAGLAWLSAAIRAASEPGR